MAGGGGRVGGVAEYGLSSRMAAGPKLTYVPCVLSSRLGCGEARVWERPHEGEQCGGGIASQLSHSPCGSLDKQLGLLGKQLGPLNMQLGPLDKQLGPLDTQLDRSVPHFSHL